jgi:hypothetical protein
VSTILYNILKIIILKPVELPLMVGNSEGKRPLGRPRRRWVANIKMDLRDIGWDSMDWIDLPQDREQWSGLVNAVMNLRVP